MQSKHPDVIRRREGRDTYEYHSKYGGMTGVVADKSDPGSVYYRIHKRMRRGINAGDLQTASP